MHSQRLAFPYVRKSKCSHSSGAQPSEQSGAYGCELKGPSVVMLATEVLVAVRPEDTLELLKRLSHVKCGRQLPLKEERATGPKHFLEMPWHIRQANSAANKVGPHPADEPQTLSCHHEPSDRASVDEHTHRTHGEASWNGLRDEDT